MKHIFEKVWELALPYQDKRDDRGHAEVTFNYAKRLAKLEEGNKEIILPAIILHDIGWIEGQKRHHKTALHTILNTPLMPFDNKERLIIGSIARYHRRALPKEKHAHFAALSLPQRDIVSVLAAILRVADGLDRTHQSLVQDISCEITPEQILVRCSVRRPAEAEHRSALKKGQLLKKVFKRKLIIEFQYS